MRKIDKRQAAVARFEFPVSYGCCLILDAEDAAAFMTILARNPLYDSHDDPEKYNEKKRRFMPALECISVDMIHPSRVDWPAPSLAEAIEDAREAGQ